MSERRGILFKWLSQPAMCGRDLNAYRAMELRSRIIREKFFLRSIYEEWYRFISGGIPPGPGRVLEIGSGGGFLRDFVPDLITSDVVDGPGIDLILTGSVLSFKRGSLKAIVMVDVLHHLADPGSFLLEASRCVRSSGRLLLVEPWVTKWSSFIYGSFHHEPFSPFAKGWESSRREPMTGANIALPWIMLHRDRERFESEFPEWKIVSIRPILPFRYLLSGGISLRGMMPDWTHPFWKSAEDALRPWIKSLAMFAEIVLVRK